MECSTATSDSPLVQDAPITQAPSSQPPVLTQRPVPLASKSRRPQKGRSRSAQPPGSEAGSERSTSLIERCLDQTSLLPQLIAQLPILWLRKSRRPYLGCREDKCRPLNDHPRRHHPWRRKEDRCHPSSSTSRRSASPGLVLRVPSQRQQR